jgi:cytoskeleton protein RodZ
LPTRAAVRYFFRVPTVAEQLRQAREAMQLDIHQVAEVTKLKTDHIRALEQGEYEVFTAPVYLRGSLRTYAKMLKLDPVGLVEQLDGELAAPRGRTEEAAQPLPTKTPVDYVTLLLSRVNWVVALVIIGLIVIGLVGNASYRAWRNHKAADPLKNLGPGIYQPSLNAGETLPLPTNAPRP